MLASRLPEISQRLRREVPPAAHESAGKTVVTAARVRVPKKTWNLHDSIHSMENRVGDSVQTWVVADAHAPPTTGERSKTAHAGAAYGKFVEFGTHHASPHPFMVPALEESRRLIVTEVAGLVNEACR